MKRSTLTVVTITALLAATAVFMLQAPPPVPMFSFVWKNNYDTNLPEELTLIISTTNLLTPVGNWEVLGATRDGRFSIPETNACRFFSIINCDSNTMRFSGLPE